MTRDEILKAVSAGAMNIDDASKALAALDPPGGRMWCKVAPSGGLSVYGMTTKWPTTLYVEQWERLIAFIPEIQAFAKKHASEFSKKGDPPRNPPPKDLPMDRPTKPRA
jgi:hypothetical protein